MINIPLQLINGRLLLTHPLPIDAIRVEFDGVAEVGRVYQRGDILPVQQKTANEILADRLAQCDQIKEAGKAYLFAQIDPDGIALVERLVAVGHPYGLENSQWCIDLRKDQYLRMAQVEAGVVDFSPELLDFSDHGDKPYTVVQMMMASGL